jgi:VanZ family protein
MQVVTLARIAGVIVVLAIWILSLMPLKEAVLPGGDKLHHFVAYGTVMFVWIIALAPQTRRQQISLAILFILMGIAVEFIQGIVPYRFFSWADALANAVGVLLGWLIGVLLLPIWRAIVVRTTSS